MHVAPKCSMSGIPEKVEIREQTNQKHVTMPRASLRHRAGSDIRTSHHWLREKLGEGRRRLVKTGEGPR